MIIERCKKYNIQKECIMAKDSLGRTVYRTTRNPYIKAYLNKIMFMNDVNNIIKEIVA